MKNPDEPSFSDLLNDLLDPDSRITDRRLAQLSNLGTEDLARLDEAWIRIPMERRRKLVAGMEALAADDPLLFFEEIGKIALKDPDPDVRVSAIRLTAIEEAPAFVSVLIDLMENENGTKAWDMTE